jgi:hypothetical protein
MGVSMTRKLASATSALLSILLLLAAPALARAGESETSQAPLGAMIVDGTFTTQVVPCGTLCTQSAYRGDLSGTSDFTLVSLEATPIKNVSRYVGTLVIHTADGDLIGQDIGYWNTATGKYVDTYKISGGKGAFEGARGVLHLAGTLDPVTGTGSSTYEGFIYWPCEP